MGLITSAISTLPVLNTNLDVTVASLTVAGGVREVAVDNNTKYL